MTNETEPRRAVTAMSVALFACMLVTLAFGMGKLTGTLDPLVARRGVGAMIGLMLVVTGNFVPKLRLFQSAPGAADSGAMDRFAGWTFVACGLAFAVAFLLAPADQVFVVPPLIVLAGFLAVLARWLPWKGRQPRRPAAPVTAGRLAMAAMLATVPWTCAIFLADTVWGDGVSKWMGILFPFVLISFLGFRVVKLGRSLDASRN